MSLRRLALLLLIALPLAACGNKGPLVKPADKSAVPAAPQTPPAPGVPAESGSR